MLMSFLEKLEIVFKYSFSSFLEIELLVLTLLFFILLGLNIKRKSKIINYICVAIVCLFIITLMSINIDYTMYCIDFLLKGILNYIYFPSTVIYFFIVVIITGCLIYTVVSDKLSIFKKIINYLCFGILYFLFFSFIGEVIITKVDIADKVSLYTNNLVLAVVQISNFVFICWLIYTCFFHLFRYFKRKYD